MTKSTVDLPALARRRGRFPAEAYRLVIEGLGRARALAPSEARHRTALELVEGVCDLAAERYSALASLVLADWGMTTSAEVGEATFHLVAEQVLRAADDDDPNDFNAGGDLAPLLERRLRIRLLDT